MEREDVKILIACEHSGVVRDAFRARGFNAVSCDLLPSEAPGPHIQGDVRKVLNDGWDVMIAHPDCTYLCSSGLHWNKRVEGRSEKTEEALAFVRELLDAPIPHIALENPVGCISTRIRKASQYIQPYEFGDDASKKTGLWLKNLPELEPTNYIHPRMVSGKPRWGNQTDSGQNRLGPSDDRWKARSLTYRGIADAMAKQWGDFLLAEGSGAHPETSAHQALSGHQHESEQVMTQPRLIEDPTYNIDNDVIHVDDIVLGPGEKSLPSAPDHLVASIQAYGVLEPVIIDQANVLIEGRRRVASCKKLGLEEVPCRRLTSSDGGNIDAAIASRIALTSHATRGENVLTEFMAIERLRLSGYSEPQIMAVTGLNVNTFRKRLQLANLRQELLDYFADGRMAVTTAEAAAKLDSETQDRLIELAKNEERITGPMVKAVKERRSEEAFEALEIPGFEDLPMISDIERDTMVVRRSVMLDLYSSIAHGEQSRSMALMAVLFPDVEDALPESPEE